MKSSSFFEHLVAITIALACAFVIVTALDVRRPYDIPIYFAVGTIAGLFARRIAAWVRGSQ